MALSAKERRALLGSSHRLKPAVTLAAGVVSDGAVAHVRAALRDHRLLKVRVTSDERRECDAVAAELARRVPCELVKRVGRTILLYQRGPEHETVV